MAENTVEIPEPRTVVSAFFLGWYRGKESILVDRDKGVIPMFGLPADPAPPLFVDQLMPQLCGSECVDVREAGRVLTVPLTIIIITGTVVSPNLNAARHVWRWAPVETMLHRRTFTDLVVAMLRSDIEGFVFTEAGDRAGWFLTFPKAQTDGGPAAVQNLNDIPREDQGGTSCSSDGCES